MNQIDVIPHHGRSFKNEYEFEIDDEMIHIYHDERMIHRVCEIF